MQPLSLFIAFSLSLFEFKESKKLNIIQSFGIKASHLYTKSILYMFPIQLALVVSSFLVNEDPVLYEHVGDVLSKLGQVEKAQEYYQKAYRLLLEGKRGEHNQKERLKNKLKR